MEDESTNCCWSREPLLGAKGVMSEWQTMETAPKSIGEQFLASDGECVVPAEWTGDQFCWHNITCHIDFNRWFQPTHWLPLPLSPSTPVR